MSDALIARFERHCAKRHITLHPGQKIVADAILRAAVENPEAARFMLAIGGGRKFAMRTIATFFQNLAHAGNVTADMFPWLAEQESIGEEPTEVSP